jgi:hypothetical protein
MARSRIVNLANFQQFTAINFLSDPGMIGGPKIIPSCAAITIGWQLPGGKAGHNVLTGRYTGTFSGSVAQANAMLLALATGAPATALLSHLSANTHLIFVNIRDLNTANQPLISSTTPGVVGSAAGPPLPNEMALVITEHTALTGRANRGRMYIPGWSSAAVDVDNTAVAAAVTDLQAWANTVQNALNGSGYQLVIGQPARAAYVGSTGTAHPARPAGSVTVQSLVVRDNHWDSQRRRGLK